MEGYAGREFVGIDLHRRRSVIVRKNDERDATDLADLLRMDRLPEAWIAPSATPGLGVWWISRRRASAKASLGSKAS